MDILGSLWQLGILAAVLVFGIKLGLASGLSKLSKKNLALVCIGYGGGIMLLSAISSIYTDEITAFINSYNSFLFIIMAAIMIFSGIYTIKEYKKHENNAMKTTRVILIAPCPCYFGSILASILMAAPTVGLGAFALSQYVAIALVLTIIVSFFAASKIVRFLKKPYPIVLGNFMLFLGIYFLLSAILIPNMIEVFSHSMNYITIPSLTNLVLAFVFALAVIVIGYMVSKKSDFLIDF